MVSVCMFFTGSRMCYYNCFSTSTCINRVACICLELTELGDCYELKFVWSLMIACGLLGEAVCCKQYCHYATYVHWLVDLMYSVFRECPIGSVSRLIVEAMVLGFRL